MQENPVLVIIHDKKHGVFQEANGMLYQMKNGDGMLQYTVIIEKENLNVGVTQMKEGTNSILELIVSQQAKRRQQAERIADKIIEEIIIQKSKQQQTSNLVKEQSEEIRKLTEDIMHGSASVGGGMQYHQPTILRRDVSTSSIDWLMSQQQTQRPPITISSGMSSGQNFAQQKNELIQQIDRQIERNIQQHKSNIGSNNNSYTNVQYVPQPSYDNISQSSHITPRGGSPKLNEIRSITKSKSQQQSPGKLALILNKCSNGNVQTALDDRMDTDISAHSYRQSVSGQGGRVSPLMKSFQDNQTGFDLKEYMRQAILSQQGKKGSNIISGNVTESDSADLTPAFNLVQDRKKKNGHSKGFTSQQFPSINFKEQLTNNSQQEKKPQKKQHLRQKSNFTLQYQQNSSTPSSNKSSQKNDPQKGDLSNRPSDYLFDCFSINSQLSPEKDGQIVGQQPGSRKASITLRDAMRDKLKLQSGKMSPVKEVLTLESARMNTNDSQKLGQGLSITHRRTTTQSTEAGDNPSVNDFISKINEMLLKSAQINTQVQQRMRISEQILLPSPNQQSNQEEQ